MENQVEKFDPSTLMQGVKDRIKSQFVSLIPDDQWAGMIQKEIEEFFKQRVDSHYRRHDWSPFSDLVHQELCAEAKSRVAKYLSSEEFNLTYNQYGSPHVAKKIEELLINNSAEIFTQMLGGMFTGMLANFRVELQNQRH